MTKNILLAVGWGLAVALTIILYIEMRTIHKLTTQVEEVQTSLVTAKENVAKMVDLEARYQELESVVAAMEQARDAAVETANDLKEKAILPEDIDAGTEFKETVIMRFTGKPATSIFSRMFNGDQGEEMLDASLDGVVDMQYAQLYDDLGLSDDRRESFRALLLSHMQESSHLGLASMQGEEVDGTEIEASDANFRVALEELLSPEELALFDAYEEEMPQRMMRQQFDMSIGMLAPRLSEPARDHTVDVLVEHLSTMEFDDVSSAPFSPEFVEVMRASYEAAAVQLEGELDATEAAAARRFIEQMAAGIDMMADMMAPDASDAATAE